MTLIPRKFKRTEVSVYNPDGSFLCKANYHTLMDLQCQIAEQKLEGVTYEWEDKKGSIDSKGQLSDWFYGMFDLDQKMFAKLFRLRTEKELKQYPLSDLNAAIDAMVEAKDANLLLAQEICGALNDKGADLGNVSEMIVKSILDK